MTTKWVGLRRSWSYPFCERVTNKYQEEQRKKEEEEYDRIGF